jgi:hypothetical protein
MNRHRLGNAVAEPSQGRQDGVELVGVGDAGEGLALRLVELADLEEVACRTAGRAAGDDLERCFGVVDVILVALLTAIKEDLVDGGVVIDPLDIRRQVDRGDEGGV